MKFGTKKASEVRPRAEGLHEPGAEQGLGTKTASNLRPRARAVLGYETTANPLKPCHNVFRKRIDMIHYARCFTVLGRCASCGWSRVEEET